MLYQGILKKSRWDYPTALFHVYIYRLLHRTNYCITFTNKTEDVNTIAQR